MRVLFAGSPPFATPILDALASSRHALAGLLTPPARPRGRGRRVEESELASRARERGVPVVEAVNANDPAIVERLRGLAADVLVVASFGQLLKDPLLELAPHGALNVHASLLPRHRGASPVARAIAAGDAETGVSIQRMVRKLDAGPVCAMRRTPIDSKETAGQLTERLARLGAAALLEALDAIESATARFVPQDEALATYAPKLAKEDGRIDWSLPAAAIERHVRAMSPWPGAWSFLRRSADPTKGGEGPVLLRVLEARADESVAHAAPPGTILGLPRDTVDMPPKSLGVATSAGALVLDRVQSEGGKVVSGPDFLRGQRLVAGALLSS